MANNYQATTTYGVHYSANFSALKQPKNSLPGIPIENAHVRKEFVLAALKQILNSILLNKQSQTEVYDAIKAYFSTAAQPQSLSEQCGPYFKLEKARKIYPSATDFLLRRGKLENLAEIEPLYEKFLENCERMSVVLNQPKKLVPQLVLMRRDLPCYSEILNNCLIRLLDIHTVVLQKRYPTGRSLPGVIIPSLTAAVDSILDQLGPIDNIALRSPKAKS